MRHVTEEKYQWERVRGNCGCLEKTEWDSQVITGVDGRPSPQGEDNERRHDVQDRGLTRWDHFDKSNDRRSKRRQETNTALKRKGLIVEELPSLAQNPNTEEM